MMEWFTDLFEAALGVSRSEEEHGQHGHHHPQHHSQARARGPRATCGAACQRLSHLCFLQTPAYPHNLTLLSLSFKINPTFHFAHSVDSFFMGRVALGCLSVYPP